MCMQAHTQPQHDAPTWKSWSSMPKRSRRLRKTWGQYSLNLKWLGRFSLGWGGRVSIQL